jgi:hypothetical protein
MKPVSDETIKDIAHHLYNIEGDCDPELYKAIATLRQLINEEFKPTKSVTSQFIYDILSPCLNQLMYNELLALIGDDVPITGLRHPDEDEWHNTRNKLRAALRTAAAERFGQ